jgi:hypothetical protein
VGDAWLFVLAKCARWSGLVAVYPLSTTVAGRAPVNRPKVIGSPESRAGTYLQVPLIGWLR